MKEFPKIFQLGHKEINGLLDDEVEITEKIDGSQFIVGKDKEGKLHMRSKGAVINPDQPPNLFRPVVEYFLSIEKRLFKNTSLYGETLCKPRHNTLAYSRVPKNHFMLFAMSNFDGSHFSSSYFQLESFGEMLGVEVVPLLFQGKATIDMMDKLLPQESVLGGETPEGVVVKRYTEHELYGQTFPLMSGKFVTEKFREKHQKIPMGTSGGNKILQEFERYNTEARFNKAVSHLKEKGELEGSPKDIGKLMKELREDLLAECEEELKELLWNGYFKKDFIKVSTRGFPQWYKEKLMDDG